MSLHLNGWRRLWIVVAAVYAVVAIAVAFSNVPVMNDVPQSRALVDRLPEEHRSLLKGFIPDDGLEAEFPNGHVLKFRQGTEQSQIQPVTKAYAAVLDGELTARRKQFALSAFVFWLVPVVALYGAGEAIAWIRRGFSNAQKP